MDLLTALPSTADHFSDYTAPVVPVQLPTSVPQPQTHTPTSHRLWALPHQPEAAGAARRLARSTLSTWGIGSDASDQALLVVSELVTNAVEHALPPLALRLDHSVEAGTVHVEVTDGGPAAEEGPWTASCQPEEHGRGCGIIDALATAHGARTCPTGSTCWADLPTAA